ncbi:MAG: cytochrome c [Gammaproteobacteria bacterium]|nr:cytochrome c [Gammaproteobacteria bacterium]
MKIHFVVTTLAALLSTNLLAGVGNEKHDMSSMQMGAHWASPSDAANKPNPIKSNENSISKGNSIYQKSCSSCHGKNAMGDGPTGAYLNPKPANLQVMSGMHKDGDFAWKIANGRGAMPAWKGTLSESEIWHTVNFIQSLKASSVQKDNDGHGGGSDHH